MGEWIRASLGRERITGNNCIGKTGRCELRRKIAEWLSQINIIFTFEILSALEDRLGRIGLSDYCGA